MQNEQESRCEAANWPHRPKRKSNLRSRKQTMVIAPSALGLSDEQFNHLISGWVVPRLVAEFVSEMKKKRAQPAADESVTAQQLADNRAA